MAKKPLKKKPMLRTEQVAVKKPTGTPVCQLHNTAMEFEAINNVWGCPVRGCNQKAFPKVELDKYAKPVVLSGPLELVRVDDPGGSKAGRLLIRGRDGGSIMVDVTDHTVELEGAQNTSGVFEVRVTLQFWDMTDARRR